MLKNLIEILASEATDRVWDQKFLDQILRLLGKALVNWERAVEHILLHFLYVLAVRGKWVVGVKQVVQENAQSPLIAGFRVVLAREDLWRLHVGVRWAEIVFPRQPRGQIAQAKPSELDVPIA